MSLAFKIAGIALLHIAFFACYPDTGGLGNYYLAGSLLVWTVFVLFINTSTALLRFISGAAGAVINTAAFALMAAALAVTMPQADRVSVLEKVADGRYPDRATLDRGLRRFGIRAEKQINGGLKELDKEAAKAVEKLKGSK